MPIVFDIDHPAGILRSQLGELGINGPTAARALDIRTSHMRRVLNGQVPITADLAARFEDRLGISAVQLCEAQRTYDLAAGRKAA